MPLLSQSPPQALHICFPLCGLMVILTSRNLHEDNVTAGKDRLFFKGSLS